MVWPYVVCCIGINGYVLALRFAGPGESAEDLAEHTAPAPGSAAGEFGIALPINIMIVDRNGKAMCATISSDKGLTFQK